MTQKFNAPFWWYGAGLASRGVSLSLSPLGWLYGMGARLQQRQTCSYVSALPVICVGNYTAGGAGKTPVALFLAERLREMGERPCFLTRGYGGRERGPHLIDVDRDRPARVGDEPLLLARHAPVMVSADRAAGARAIEQLAQRENGPEKAAPSVIVMDDGFQNQGLYKDLSIIVTDGVLGLGNGQVIPAGPLRGFLSDQLAETGLFVMSRPGPACQKVSALAKGKGIPVLEGELLPSPQIREWLSGRKVYAYTGIGHPGKFYDLLQAWGAELMGTRSFPDHHAYGEQDARELLALEASFPQAAFVTTEKDAIKLEGIWQEGQGHERARLASLTKTIPVSLQLDDIQPLCEALMRILQEKRGGGAPLSSNTPPGKC